MAKARLVRYADDYVLMARYVGSRITGWVDETVEGWLGLKIDRGKTRVVRVTRESGSTLDLFWATPSDTTGMVLDGGFGT